MVNTYQSIKFTPEKRSRKGMWIMCETCHKEFYVFPERIKNGNPRFCSQKCYSKIGKNNPFFGHKHTKETKEKWTNNINPNKGFKYGINNPNFIRFGKQSGFTGTTLDWWKNYFNKTIKKCEICGFNDIRILEVHHKNCEREENIRQNLIFLCPNCHSLEHWKNRTGKYKWRK